MYLHMYVILNAYLILSTGRDFWVKFPLLLYRAAKHFTLNHVC